MSTDFELGTNTIDISAIFDGSEFGEDVLSCYIKFEAAGSRNSLVGVIDPLVSGDAQRSVSRKIAIVNRMQATELSESNFIL